MQSGARSYLLYAVTIFASAFLLFAIQPIAGKHLLPYFGGSSSVWATSMLFFTGALFLGYAYVYFLCKAARKKQARIHIGVISVGVAAVLLSLLSWHSLYPALDWTIGSQLPPALLTLLSLLVSIGIPYFILATTGPLLQYWYGVGEGKEPYKLYAISNAGSLLALLSYPFLIEPHVRLSEQEITWAIFFCAYAALCAVVSSRLLREGRTPSHASSPAGEVRDPASAPSASGLATGPHPRLTRALVWIAYAAFPSLLLVATTTQITQTVAPIPLLWILPLSLYLITFIIAFAPLEASGSSKFSSFVAPLTGFAGFRLFTHSFVHFLTAVLLFSSAIAAWWFIDATFNNVQWKIAASLSLLFFASLVCHSELYRLRPEKTLLPLFYLFLSFGGMVGALLASILAPVFFNDYWEFPISIALSATLAVYLIGRDSEGKHRRIIHVLSYALVGLIAAVGYTYATHHDTEYRSITRNFYGTTKVEETDSYRSLVHGGTMHGLQYFDEKFKFIPASYYVEETGMGRAVAYTRARNKDKSLSMAVIGLGAGMTAAYCTEGDTLVYYEIDPRILTIAETEFSYLTLCPQVDIRIGDARIVLEKEKREGNTGAYDLIVMDAFNDDTIPVHLLTKEAIETFLAHLKDERSIIAVHISNRYLDLRPPLVAIANELGLSILVVDTVSVSEVASGSTWVLLSKSPETFKAANFEGATGEVPEETVQAWTDDYSDILSIYRVVRCVPFLFP